MYACVCAAVSTAQVDAVILAGASSVDEIGDRCGAGTGCGTCVDRLCDLLDAAESRADVLGELQRSA